MINQRWKNAQRAEKEFWQTRKSWVNEINEKHWGELINHGFNLNFDFFNNRDILEIGCGATGIIFFINNAKSRIGIEPMDMDNFINDWKKKFVRKGVGEELPFDKNSFDLVICFNALDHSLDPAKIIQEAHRVLRDKGEFLLMLHALRSQYKFLQQILNKVDRPHPHHFTFREIQRLVSNNKNNSYEVKRINVLKGLYLPIKYRSIKVMIGNLMMEDVWLWLRKRS